MGIKEDKSERLRVCLDNNGFITKEFKLNIGTLTDALVDTFPDYDYSHYEEILNSLKISSDNGIESYCDYDRGNNNIKLNLDKMLEDRIDMQHLFLTELLLVGSKAIDSNENFKNYNIGMSEAIASTMNNDESMKKLNPVEYHEVSILSKIVNPESLINSFMKQDITDVAMELDSYGISQEEFLGLLQAFNKKDTGFAESEKMMISMYEKKIKSKLNNKEMSYDDISLSAENFGDMLILSRNDLINLYPRHDFSNLKGFNGINEQLETVIGNVEKIEPSSYSI